MSKNPIATTFRKTAAAQAKLEKQMEHLRDAERKELFQAAEKLVGREFTISEPRSPRCHGKFSYRIVAVHHVGRDYDGVPVLHFSAELVKRPKSFRRPSVERRVGKVYRKQIRMSRINQMKVK